MSPVLSEKPSGAYRVLHTADWHLGKMLGSLSRLEEQTRFLAWLETLIGRESIDALIIAGDIFDSASPPQSAQRLYYEFLAALHAKTACTVVVIAGNHDSPAQLQAPEELLRVVNTRVAARLARSETGEAEPALFVLPTPEEPQLVVAALPFLREADLRRGEAGESAEQIREALRHGIACRYQEAAEAAAEWKAKGVPLMATGHLTALGSKGSESEREIHVGGLGAVGAEAFPEVFDYIALGHLHRPQAVGGREQIRYSGSPIALSFSEAEDRKEVRILDFAQGRLLRQEAVPVPVERSLIRLRFPQQALKKSLKEPPTGEGELPAWVEVTVTEADRSEDLFTAVQGATQEWRSAEIIRVCAEYAALGPRLEAGPERGDDLLEDPRAVFALRLDQETMEEEAREAVKLAFAELYSRWQEKE